MLACRQRGRVAPLPFHKPVLSSKPEHGDVRGCWEGTWWGDEPGRAHSSAGRAASGRASSASWRSKTSGGGGGERNYEKIRFCGGAGLDGDNTCGIVERRCEGHAGGGRGRRRRRRGAAPRRWGWRTPAMGGGCRRRRRRRGPTPAEGRAARGGKERPSPRATRTTSSCSTCSSASGRCPPTSPVSHWFLLMMPSKAKMFFFGSPHLPSRFLHSIIDVQICNAMWLPWGLRNLHLVCDLMFIIGESDHHGLMPNFPFFMRTYMIAKQNMCGS